MSKVKSQKVWYSPTYKMTVSYPQGAGVVPDEDLSIEGIPFPLEDLFRYYLARTRDKYGQFPIYDGGWLEYQLDSVIPNVWDDAEFELTEGSLVELDFPEGAIP